jgi:hypothetical protein
VSVIGGLAYAAYEQYVKLQIKRQNSKPDENMMKQIAELQQRVQVLEKIVTDQAYDLKSQINALDRAS